MVDVECGESISRSRKKTQRCSSRTANKRDSEEEKTWIEEKFQQNCWEYWHHVQAWLKATEYAREKAEVKYRETLFGIPKAEAQFYPHNYNNNSPHNYYSFASSHFGAPDAVSENQSSTRVARSENRRKGNKNRERRRSRKSLDRDEDEEIEEVEDAYADYEEYYYEEDGYGEDEKEYYEAACDDQDEFLKLLKQNQEFRKQRDAAKRQDEEQVRKKEISDSQMPREQAGVQRTREMTDLYGAESILVQTLETKLQMKFDEYADQYRPPLWPSIPLNLSY